MHQSVLRAGDILFRGKVHTVPTVWLLCREFESCWPLLSELSPTLSIDLALIEPAVACKPPSSFLLWSVPAGKTTLLTELCHEMYWLLTTKRERMLSLIMAALGGDCLEEAESLVETLLRSLQPGRQLVIWLRCASFPCKWGMHSNMGADVITAGTR